MQAMSPPVAGPVAWSCRGDRRGEPCRGTPDGPGGAAPCGPAGYLRGAGGAARDGRGV